MYIRLLYCQFALNFANIMYKNKLIYDGVNIIELWRQRSWFMWFLHHSVKCLLVNATGEEPLLRLVHTVLWIALGIVETGTGRSNGQTLM